MPAPPYPRLVQPWPHPDLDLRILQVDVPVGQHVAVGSRLDEEALHLDEVGLGQAVPVLLVEDAKRDAIFCKEEEGVRVHVIAATFPHNSTRLQEATQWWQLGTCQASPDLPWLQGGSNRFGF